MELSCPACGTANPAGAKFCVECGTRLGGACPTCGATSNPAGARFCAECGTRLAAGGAPVAAVATAPLTAAQTRSVEPQTERRVVSVLFADLVGFTARSDGIDPEQTREFLASYFELGREVIARYGGTVEKFIGDAVMALWGAPIAREDDPERAVRAALELVDSVRRLGRDVGDAELALRAGVLTGEAAVAIGAEGQGLVAGDLVNTASRLQSVAPPGVVLVGESTYRAAERAIAFEPAGDQVLKGKAAPVPAWRALRVVAERGGLGRSEGIEAPFVGRDDELRLLKDLLHSVGRERRVRLVSVTGQAGVGKSRLAWEFLKYIDGVLEPIYYHQGRSPAFGEGVTFWALGEMVRRRAKLAESDDEATTRERIAATLEEYVPESPERDVIEPAMLSLLGIGEAPSGGREALFAALRTFFERISILGTTVLVFEDLQWADPSVGDFIDHLLEWSIGYPILVVTLARPELLERRPDWGAGRRDFVALALGPLAEGPMRELLAGLVPDLPERTIRAILDRADGIPLYAVETVRMLVADGRLADRDGRYEVIGDLGDLRIPDTLQSLIASRLDALDPADRSLLQDGAVLGQTFSVPALAALAGETLESLEPRLRALVRREVLQLDTDPRSPERGQFGFTQALVREVAYGTLAKRDRRSKHLAAARYFETLEDEEVAGVLATHYVDAWAAAPDGPEGEAVAAQARIALRAAADRAVSLGAKPSAVAYWERARQVTVDPAETAELLERIGVAQLDAGHWEAAERDLRAAVDAHRSLGDGLAVVRATEKLAWVVGKRGDATAAMAMLLEVERDAARLGAHPVRVKVWVAIGSNPQQSVADALGWVDRALRDAEQLAEPSLVAEAMGLKGVLLGLDGRPLEGRALLEAAARMASAEGDWYVAARTMFQLALGLIEVDPRASVEAGRRTLELTRRYGFGSLRLTALINAVEAAIWAGDWGWIDEELGAIRIEDLEPADRSNVLAAQAELGAFRGIATDEQLAEVESFARTVNDSTTRSAVDNGIAIVRLAEGRYVDAYDRGLTAGADPLNAPSGLSLAVRAAVRLGDVARAKEALARLMAIDARGAVTNLNRAALAAAVDGLEGRWPEASAGFREAWRRYRDLGLFVGLAVSQLDAIAVGPPDDPMLEIAAAEARAIFEREGAVAFLAQLDALEKVRMTHGSSIGLELRPELAHADTRERV